MTFVGERTQVLCSVCGARVSELRRGRCWHCYSQWCELRPVGKGATCAVCGERRREQLRLMELHGRSVSFCHGCAARVLRLSPLPHALEDVRSALARERRMEDRRDDGLDQRIFPRERRVDDRRVAARAETPAQAQPALAGFEDELIIEIDEGDIEAIEQTIVQERPAAPVAAAEPAV